MGNKKLKLIIKDKLHYLNILYHQMRIAENNIDNYDDNPKNKNKKIRAFYVNAYKISKNDYENLQTEINNLIDKL
jgi:hypothetical protein